MLSFSDIFKRLEQTVKTLNASGYFAYEIRLRRDKKYILNMESGYKNIKQKYEKEMKLVTKQDYYAVAYFFWIFLDLRKLDKPPIDFFDVNGDRYTETSFSIKKGLKEVLRKEVSVALLAGITIDILNPKSNDVVDKIEEIIKNLSTAYDKNKSFDVAAIFELAAFFRDL